MRTRAAALVLVALVLLLALTTVAAPLAAEAQQAGKVPRIGFLQPGEAPGGWMDAFRRGLRELGWVEGPAAAAAGGSGD